MPRSAPVCPLSCRLAARTARCSDRTARQAPSARSCSVPRPTTCWTILSGQSMTASTHTKCVLGPKPTHAMVLICPARCGRHILQSPGCFYTFLDVLLSVPSCLDRAQAVRGTRRKALMPSQTEVTHGVTNTVTSSRSGSGSRFGIFTLRIVRLHLMRSRPDSGYTSHGLAARS